MSPILFCDCREDGWCPRYRRSMGGRLREVCAGVDVDLGTAAAFRTHWTREASSSPPAGAPTAVRLRTDQAPGDALSMTAAIYSLHRAHPGKYLTSVESRWPEVFAHNPDVVGIEPRDGAPAIAMHYPAIHDSNERGIHFMQAWCEFLGSALGTDVPLMTNRPHLYFADSAPLVEDFWLVCSGGKRDFTNKLWGMHNYQEVVRLLEGRVNFVQVGGGQDEHPRLDGTLDAVGRTSLRELFDLARRARGVLCGVSLPMHLAAALEKPAVVVAGGREPVQWNAYPRQLYLHTVGALPCRDARGRIGGACWRSRVVPLGDGSALDRDPCQFPVCGTSTRSTGAVVPRCMELISPAAVAEWVIMMDGGRVSLGHGAGGGLKRLKRLKLE